MRYSVTMVATDTALPMAELATAVEERGLDGLWLPDHTHMPVSRTTPYPQGGDLPERYKRIIDPFVGLAMAAAVTTRIRIGTGILLVAQRDPIVTAKALATLDHLSNGRVIVGMGFGWNRDEMEDHGVVPATRRDRAREHVLAMRSLWEEEVGSYDGEYVQVSPSWSWPKPVQRPLPILIGGGANDTLFHHAAEYAQGWIPTGGKGVKAAIPRLREAFEAAGRDPSSLEIVPFSSGDTDHGKVDYLEEAGATEYAFDLPPESSDVVLPILDRIAEFVAERRRR
jgi:probable F420-dependent oxidoreductase